MLGFVIPTVGRWSALEHLLDSLDGAARAGLPVCAVVVDQGGPAGAQLREGREALPLTIVQDAGRGASRARNVGVAHLPDEVSHVVWPNDHSSYPVASLEALVERLPRADVVVGQLLEGDGEARYDVADSSEPLDLRNVWQAIEPATAISLPLLRDVGGWCTDLGAGAATPWQSSALADLLLRLAPRARVVWTPGFAVCGAGFVRGAAERALRSKVRSYGRGYGRVLSRWDYPWHRRWGSVLKPLVQPGYGVGADRLPLSARLATAVGRAEGITGRLLPGSTTDLRDAAHVLEH